MITRLAPTPSGFLHEGNAANLLLVSWLAASAGGQVALRIDDMDASRYRPEYVDDIFAVLEWLEIAWHLGPIDRIDFDRSHSQRARTSSYRDELVKLTGSSTLEVYACRCSRADLREVGAMGCVGECRERGQELIPGESALRVHVPLGTVVSVDGQPVDLAAEMGDFVLWRREDLPSYQLVSTVEDRNLGVSHVVRGVDLRASTAAQLFLARHLDAAALLGAAFLHHPLAVDDRGVKLSKSQLSSGPMEHSSAARRRIHDLARQLGAPVGITPP